MPLCAMFVTAKRFTPPSRSGQTFADAPDTLARGTGEGSHPPPALDSRHRHSNATRTCCASVVSCDACAALSAFPV